MKLSIIIPAYNEENRLLKTLTAIDKYLRQQDYDYEIIVVNDGAKDRTFEVAKSLESQIKNLKASGYPQNHGKGYAVRLGMLEAQGDYRVFTDADNSTSIDQIEKMWPEFETGFDIVIGSRDIQGAVLDPPQPWNRVLLGNLFGFFVRFTLGLWGIKDTQCGFKGFTARAAKEMFPKCKIDRFAFDPEILLIARKLGYRIKEIPVHWKNDLASKVKFKSMVKMGLDVFKIKWNSLAKEY